MHRLTVLLQLPHQTCLSGRQQTLPIILEWQRIMSDMSETKNKAICQSPQVCSISVDIMALMPLPKPQHRKSLVTLSELRLKLSLAQRQINYYRLIASRKALMLSPKNARAVSTQKGLQRLTCTTIVDRPNISIKSRNPIVSSKSSSTKKERIHLSHLIEVSTSKTDLLLHRAL